MHVAHREAERQRRSLTAGHELLGVGGGGARHRLDLHGDALGRGDLLGQLDQGVVAARAAVDHRSGAELDLATELLGVQPRVVAGEVHVDHHDDVRLPARGHRLGAHERGLFVNRGQSREHGRAGGGGVVFQGAGAHVGAGPVVEGRRGVAAAGQRQEDGGEGDGVADLDQRQCLIAAGRSDVEPLVGDLGGLGALLLAHLVGGLAADHAVHGAAGGMHDQVAAGQQLGVDAADLVERHKALFVDVGHDQTDLVVVRRDHHVRRAARGDVGPDIPKRVALGRGDAREPPSQDLLCRRFESGGRRRGAQLAQEVEVGGHWCLRGRSVAVSRRSAPLRRPTPAILSI